MCRTANYFIINQNNSRPTIWLRSPLQLQAECKYDVKQYIFEKDKGDCLTGFHVLGRSGFYYVSSDRKLIRCILRSPFECKEVKENVEDVALVDGNILTIGTKGELAVLNRPAATNTLATEQDQAYTHMKYQYDTLIAVRHTKTGAINNFLLLDKKKLSVIVQVTSGSAGRNFDMLTVRCCARFLHVPAQTVRIPHCN